MKKVDHKQLGVNKQYFGAHCKRGQDVADEDIDSVIWKKRWVVVGIAKRAPGKSTK